MGKAGVYVVLYMSSITLFAGFWAIDVVLLSDAATLVDGDDHDDHAGHDHMENVDDHDEDEQREHEEHGDRIHDGEREAHDRGDEHESHDQGDERQGLDHNERERHEHADEHEGPEHGGDDADISEHGLQIGHNDGGISLIIALLVVIGALFWLWRPFRRCFRGRESINKDLGDLTNSQSEHMTEHVARHADTGAENASEITSEGSGSVDIRV